ncbi:MAG: hypothetical protein PHY93_01325 [Bacteriovorax sp.]|nr:hypothetical protein [Bacteriovorax sp.]
MALNNLAVLETYLKDIIVSEEIITANVEMREHIFEIKDEEKTLGFISLYDLKAYVFEHEEDAKNYYVKNIDSDEWKNIYEHPFFQRRKPQLISSENLKEANDLEFFILQNGQKNGPFEKYKLMEMVEKREILLSDMVSFNGGHVWIKLFQVDGFDRRSLRENAQLPGMPSLEFLNRPSDSINNIGETTDAITSLAFLGNQKKGRTLEREREVSYKDEMEKGANSTSIYKWLLIASVFGIVYFLFSIKSHLSSPFGPSPTSSVGEQAEMLTPIENPTPSYSDKTTNNHPRNNGINDQGRMGKFETRNMNPVRPVARKSFMETNKFRDNTGDAVSVPSSEDGNYFYDNAAPMELDPVRAQISKENFDNGGEPGPAPEADPLFSGEVSN